MSAIHTKSLTGIKSITTPPGVDNVFTVHSNDTTERFRVDLNGNQRIAGILTVAQDLDVDGHTNLDNVSIAGVTTFSGGLTATGIDLNGDIDVDGHTNLDNVSIAGVTTFASTAEFDGTAKFDSSITAGGVTGNNGQYLKSTGSGVAWDSFPSLRTRSTFTASSGQTTFSFNYIR